MRKITKILTVILASASNLKSTIVYIHNFTMDEIEITVHGKIYSTIGEAVVHGVPYLWEQTWGQTKEIFTAPFSNIEIPIQLPNHTNPLLTTNKYDQLGLLQSVSSKHFLKQLLHSHNSPTLPKTEPKTLAANFWDDLWKKIEKVGPDAGKAVEKLRSDADQAIDKSFIGSAVRTMHEKKEDALIFLIKEAPKAWGTVEDFTTQRRQELAAWGKENFAGYSFKAAPPTKDYPTTPFKVPGVSCNTYFNKSSKYRNYFSPFVQFVQSKIRTTATPPNINIVNISEGEMRWVGSAVVNEETKNLHKKQNENIDYNYIMGSASAAFPYRIEIKGPSGRGSIDISKYQNNMIITVAVGYLVSISEPADPTFNCSLNNEKGYKVIGYSGSEYDPSKTIDKASSANPMDPRSADYDATNVLMAAPPFVIKNVLLDLGSTKTKIKATIALGFKETIFEIDADFGMRTYFDSKANKDKLIAEAIWNYIKNQLVKPTEEFFTNLWNEVTQQKKK